MKKYMSILLLSLVAMALSAFAEDKIRVACVGDSITFGARIKAPKDRYPQQMNKMLLEAYQVENFGQSGATLLYTGNSPYVKTKVYKLALDFKPNIVVIKLGTNDSKMMNWDKIADFEKDLNTLISSFANLETKPTIYLCTPCPAFLNGENISEDRIVKLIPIIEKVAKERSLKVIDLHTKLAGKAEMFPDKIHPNEAGAKLMAEIIKKEITK